MARERVERAKVYFEAVSSYEVVDIEAAVSNFLDGSAPGHNNQAFAPPAPMVGAETRRVMNLRLDRVNREKALRPSLPPPDVKRTPESMARVAALKAQTVEKLGASMRTEDAEKDRRMREQLARTNERFAPDMSPEAQRGRLLRRDWGYDVGDEDVA